LSDAHIESLCTAQTWLRGRAAALRQRPFSERTLQCLLGLWIAARALESTGDDGVEDLAGVVSQQLAGLHDAAISSLDSKLLLLALYILRRCGHPGYALETYGRKVANAFREDAHAHNDHVGEAIILSRLGLCDDPNGNAGASPHATALDFLNGDLEATRKLSTRICAATHFGTREARPFPGRRQIAFVTKVLLIDALNSYDIATGAMLLRLVAYLGSTNGVVIEDAQSFLLLQQQPSGHFGQYDLHAKALGDAGLDASFDLYLPLTVSCVWALAETAIRRFRVFSLPSLALSRQPA
jgi:hypothetical protein